jgi:hypothetical protein
MRLIAALGACVGVLLVMAVPALAGVGNGNGGNVGSTTHFRSSSFDAAGNAVGMTCAQVHETLVPGGYQDKQTCTLDAGAVLPKKPLSADGPLGGWASDYQASIGNFVVATSWSYTIMPSGTVTIVSFYAVP